MAQIDIKKLNYQRTYPKIKDKFGNNALHLAVETKSLPMVAAILDSERDILSSMSKNGKGLTPLQIAAQKGNKEIVDLLLKNGATGTPFVFAAEGGNSEIVEMFSPVSLSNPEKWIEGYAAMYVAAYKGHQEIVQMLLNKGVDPNGIFENYLTPLHAAAFGGQEKMVNFLLDQGAEVNPKLEESARFCSPLIAAITSGHEEIVKIFLNHNADINTKVGNNVIANNETQRLLISGSRSYDECSFFKSYYGFTAIHCATLCGKKTIVEMLIKHEADVNAKADNEDNSTPFYIAIVNESAELAAYLLRAGATLEKGPMLLYNAIRTKNIQIVDLLLRNKVNPNGMYGEMSFLNFALSISWFSSNPNHVELDIVKKLIAHGASVNYVNPLQFERVSPLFYAIKNNRRDMFKLLMKNGTSLTEKTERGLNLLHFAISEGQFPSIVKFLLECGIDVDERTENKGRISPIEMVRDMYYENYTDTENSREHYDEYYFKYGYRKDNDRLSEEKLDTIIELLLVYGYDGKMARTSSERHFLTSVILDNNINRLDLYFLGIDVNIALIKQSDSLLFSRDIHDQSLYFITQDLARMQAAGDEMSEKMIFFIQNERVHTFFLQCKQELDNMKLTIISDNLTFFDVLIASERDMTAYGKNKNIGEVMESGDLEKLFPLYGKDLKFCMKKGMEKNNLLEISGSVLNRALELNIPVALWERIFSYLSSADLRNVCRIRDPYIFVT